jgi:hypothetical protein
VTLNTVDRQTGADRTAPAVLADVADMLVAGRFADQCPGDFFTPGFERLDHLDGAVDRDALLVAGDQQGDRPKMIGMIGDKRFTGGYHRGNAGFHVGGAAAEEHAVANFGDKRVAIPFFQRPGRHYVGMTGKCKHRPILAASGPEIRDIVEHHGLAFESYRGEPLDQERLATRVIRGNRLPGDQVRGELYGCTAHGLAEYLLVLLIVEADV